MLLKKKISIFFITLLILFLENISYADECSIRPKIKVGIVENNFIDYSYYIYYALDKYSLEYDVEFELENIENNPNNFDIIFGDYKDLSKLSIKEILLPKHVSDFYEKNQIKININLLPLDLDTFIILSKEKHKYLNFEDFSNYFSPLKYSLGMSFKNKKNIINILKYNLEEEIIDPRNLSFESNMIAFSNIFKSLNKNLIESNFSEIYSSYENNENIFTLFNDGILFYKNVEYKSFQLFPKSKYIWDQKNGIFLNNDNNNVKPYSFYGLSAYVNNINNIGFACYMMNDEIRVKGFTDFNIQLSPFSNNDTYKLQNMITKEYKRILDNKYKFIQKEIDLGSNISNENIKNMIFSEFKFEDLYEFNNYLN